MLKIAGLPKYKINFKSNPFIEKELICLSKLIHQQDLLDVKEQIIESGINSNSARTNLTTEKLLAQFQSYPPVNNERSEEFAGFLTKLTCATQMKTDSDLGEYFGDEKTAADLREKLPTEECKKDSLKLREAIQKTYETKDPVMMLLAANKMVDYVPTPDLLNQEQQQKLLQGLKDTILMGISNSDMSKFEEEDKSAIQEMVQMIKDAESTDFGISEKLKVLIDKLNKKLAKRRKISESKEFIPPVMVLSLADTEKKKTEI